MAENNSSKQVEMRQCACGCGEWLTPRRKDQMYKDRKHRYRAYNQSPARKAAKKAYNQSAARKAYMKAYNQSPARKAASKAYMKAYNQSAAGKAYEQSPARKAAKKAYNQHRRELIYGIHNFILAHFPGDLGL